MIKQGSEEPIILEFDESMEDITAFTAALIIGCRIEKEYHLEDVDIDGNWIILPLSQRDTHNLYPGETAIEVEWRDSDGVKHQSEKETIYVAPRRLRREI